VKEYGASGGAKGTTQRYAKGSLLGNSEGLGNRGPRTAPDGNTIHEGGHAIGSKSRDAMVNFRTWSFFPAISQIYSGTGTISSG
jgi:hypothetical protein